MRNISFFTQPITPLICPHSILQEFQLVPSNYVDSASRTVISRKENNQIDLKCIQKNGFVCELSCKFSFSASSSSSERVSFVFSRLAWFFWFSNEGIGNIITVFFLFYIPCVIDGVFPISLAPVLSPLKASDVASSVAVPTFLIFLRVSLSPWSIFSFLARKEKDILIKK